MTRLVISRWLDRMFLDSFKSFWNFHSAKMRFMRSLSAFCISKYAFWECHFTLEIDTLPPWKGAKSGPFLLWLVRILFFSDYFSTQCSVSIFIYLGITMGKIKYFLKSSVSAYNARFLFLFAFGKMTVQKSSLHFLGCFYLLTSSF